MEKKKKRPWYRKRRRYIYFHPTTEAPPKQDMLHGTPAQDPFFREQPREIERNRRIGLEVILGLRVDRETILVEVMMSIRVSMGF